MVGTLNARGDEPGKAKPNENGVRYFAPRCKMVLHRGSDLHFVRQALSWACNISVHERQCFITAGLDSFKALGPRPAVNERTSIDFSWNRIKPFKHAMKRISKAYELEPSIYQVCVILYVEIRQQLYFHMALASHQQRLGDFNWLSHGVKPEEIFLQHPVGRNLVVLYPIVCQRLRKAAGFFAVVLGSTEALLSVYL